MSAAHEVIMPDGRVKDILRPSQIQELKQGLVYAENLLLVDSI